MLSNENFGTNITCAVNSLTAITLLKNGNTAKYSEIKYFVYIMTVVTFPIIQRSRDNN